MELTWAWGGRPSAAHDVASETESGEDSGQAQTRGHTPGRPGRDAHRRVSRAPRRQRVWLSRTRRYALSFISAQNAKTTNLIFPRCQVPGARPLHTRVQTSFKCPLRILRRRFIILLPRGPAVYISSLSAFWRVSRSPARGRVWAVRRTAYNTGVSLVLVPSFR